MMFFCVVATVALGGLPTEEQFQQQLAQFGSKLGVEAEAAADTARHSSSLAEVLPRAPNPAFENDPLVKKIEQETQQEEIDGLPANTEKAVSKVSEESTASKAAVPTEHAEHESFTDLGRMFHILSHRLAADVKGKPLPGPALFPDSDDKDDSDEETSDPSSFLETTDTSEETVEKPPADLHKVAEQLRADGALYLQKLSESLKKKYPGSKNKTTQKTNYNLKKSIKERMLGSVEEPDFNATLKRLRLPWARASQFTPPALAPLPQNASWLQRQQHDDLERRGKEHAEEMVAKSDLGLALQDLAEPNVGGLVGGSLVQSSRNSRPGESLVDRLGDAEEQIRLKLLGLAKPLRLGGLMEKVLRRHTKSDARYEAMDSELKSAEDKAKWQLAKLKKDLHVEPSSFIERASSEPSSFVEEMSQSLPATDAQLVYVPKHLKTRYGEIGERLQKVMQKSHSQLERMQKLRVNLLQETDSMMDESADDAPAAGPTSLLEEGRPKHVSHFQKQLTSLQNQAHAELAKLTAERESHAAAESAKIARDEAQHAGEEQAATQKREQEAAAVAGRSSAPDQHKMALRNVKIAAKEARAAVATAAEAKARRDVTAAVAKRKQKAAADATASLHRLEKSPGKASEDIGADASPSSFLEEPKGPESKPILNHEMSTALEDLKDVSTHLKDMVLKRKKESAEFESEAQQYLHPHPVPDLLGADAEPAAGAHAGDEPGAPSSFLEELPKQHKVALLTQADEAEEEKVEKNSSDAEQALMDTVNEAHRRMDKLDALVAERGTPGRAGTTDEHASVPSGPSDADKAAAAELLGVGPGSLLQAGEGEERERIAYHRLGQDQGSFLETPMSFADRMAEIENSIKTGAGTAEAHMDALAEKLAPNPYAEAMGVSGAAKDHLEALRHDLSDHLRKH